MIEWVLGVHLLSLHAPKREYETFTPGVYLRAEGWQAGVYRNSEAGTSAYAGRMFEAGRFFLLVGAVTGYERAKVVPLVAPGVSLGEFKISLIPEIKRVSSSSVLHIAFERKF